VSKKRVERLMKEAEIHAMAKKKYKATTDSKHSLPVAANSLNRNFSVNKLKSVLGGRYHLYLYSGRLALPIYHPGPLFPQNRGMVNEK
jgi:hypothetical protein